jgi:hypothetical protein
MSAQKLVAMVGGALLAGVIAGFALAIALVRTEIQVDYDSGAIREVVSAGPITVREGKYGHAFFGSVRMPNGQTALNGAGDWHVALSFKGSRNVSPLFEAGQVLNDISKLEQLPWKDSASSLAAVKQQFLESLSKDGVHAASALVKATEQRLIGASTNQPLNN